jgi:hypothetical protein
MKDVPARTCTARELGLDLGEQTLNAQRGAAMTALKFHPLADISDPEKGGSKKLVSELARMAPRPGLFSAVANGR